MKKIRSFFKRLGLCRTQAVILAVCLSLTILFHLTKHCKGFIDAVTDWVILPLQWLLRQICSLFAFSVAELAIVLLVAAVLVFLTQSIVQTIRRKGARLRTAFTRGATLLCAVLIGTTGFDWMWGSFYYRSSFQEQTGIIAEEVSADALYRVTSYFVKQANETAERIPRGEDGDLSMTPQTIAQLSVSVYDGLEETYPIFAKARTAPKVLVLSEGLSYLNCTGFYFPYLGESNLNGHSPRTAIPATAVHELAHQMGIASEQEANFAAVLSCTQSEYPAFIYSGWQLGLIYLLNALARADRALWEEVQAELSDTVRKDFVRINTYWAQYDTPVGDAADRINSGRQENYGQDLKTQSYGAVVDLLVAYYDERI